MDAQPSYRARIGDALDLLYDVLRPFVEREMREAYGPDWLTEARAVLHDKAPERWDTSDLLMLIYKRFFASFREIGHEGRSRASLLKEVRTRWAHQADLTATETRRALEDTIHLLRAVGADAEADRLEPQVRELMQAELMGAEPSGRPLVREPLELRRDVLDAVEDALAPHRSNPALKAITIHLHAPDEDTKLLFESAIEGHDRPFGDAARRRLSNAGIRDADRLRIRTHFHEAAWPYGAAPYAVELHRRAEAATATLAVVHGKAEQEWYLLKSDGPMPIGRTGQVADRRGRVVRHNRVVFSHYEGLPEDFQRINRTVSRAHATISFDEKTGEFVVRDDQSTAGTSVVRESFPVPIPVKRRGVSLESGDLIYLGNACLRFSKREE